MPYAKTYARPYPYILYSHLALAIRIASLAGIAYRLWIHTVKIGIASVPAVPASIASHTQSPSKAPRRPSKARKTRRLGQGIGQAQNRAQGPLNRSLFLRNIRAQAAIASHCQPARSPLGAWYSRGISARVQAGTQRLRTRLARVNTRVAQAQAGAYGGAWCA